MNVPARESLPLQAHAQEIVLNDELLRRFQSAFGSEPSDRIPPTVGAVALQGVFEILNLMQVNWKGLLHASQSFEYRNELHRNQVLVATARLIDARLRGGMHWLQFETTVIDKNTGQELLLSKSLIMVKADS